MSDEIPPIEPPSSEPHSFPPPSIPEPSAAPSPIPMPPEESAPVETPHSVSEAATTAAPPVSLPLPEGPAYGSGKLSESDDKMFCILSHILCIIVGFVAPLLIWLLKKDESPAVEAHAKESLNFQLTLLLAYVLCVILAAVTCGILTPLVFVPIVYGIVMCIIATMKANEGKLYRYPMTLRLIK